MSQKTVKKGCLAVVGLYIFFVLLYFFASGDQLRYLSWQTDMLVNNSSVGEVTSGMELIQPVYADGVQAVGLTLKGAAFGRQNTGRLCVELYAGDQVLAASEMDLTAMPENGEFFVGFEEPVTIPNGSGPFVRVTAPDSEPGNAVELFVYDNATGPEQGGPSLREDECLRMNGETKNAALCVQVNGRTERFLGRYYWYFAAAGLAVVALFCFVLLARNKKGKPSVVLGLWATFSRYRYLIKQLVRRDFTTKYKRSVLGILWSLLNPLLTMAVQYVVFSRLFRSDIPNFALYLLSGIVVYNGVNEAATLALLSIVGNAQLITKVYVPKYIYPLTRVLASMINFLLTLLPLFVVMLVTGAPVNLSLLLLPLGIVCVFALALGIGMFLASAMVFFRDTQFLWGVISMLWMYITPIIYPESIIAPQFMTVYKCNPLYHIVLFFRTILMDGAAPELKVCVLMMISALVPLALGALVFKKTQDRFVLYI